MIFKCAGCEGVFHVREMENVNGGGWTLKTDLLPPDTPLAKGLCPACALATIKSMGLDAALHGVQIVNGRANERR